MVHIDCKLPIKPGRHKKAAGPVLVLGCFEGLGIVFYQSMFTVKEFVEEAEIVSCSCELLAPHLYGEVIAGHLQLQTQVLLLGLHRGTEFHEHHFTKLNTTVWRQRLCP